MASSVSRRNGFNQSVLLDPHLGDAFMPVTGLVSPSKLKDKDKVTKSATMELEEFLEFVKGYEVLQEKAHKDGESELLPEATRPRVRFS